MQKRAFNIIQLNSVYRKDENYYRKVFLEKYNFNDSDEEYFDDSDDSYKKI